MQKVSLFLLVAVVITLGAFMNTSKVKTAWPTKDFDARFSVEQGGRNEVRTTEQWLRSYYDLLSKESKQAH